MSAPRDPASVVDEIIDCRTRHGHAFQTQVQILNAYTDSLLQAHAERVREETVRGVARLMCVYCADGECARPCCGVPDLWEAAREAGFIK